MKVLGLLFAVAAALVLAASAVFAAPSVTPSGLPRLKPSYEPARLTPGTYRTPEGFVPATTFRVGANWYGTGDSHGWGIGKGWIAWSSDMRSAPEH